jgi:hypothetical protein
VAARRVGVQVDADVAVLLDALHQLGDAGGRVDAGALRQHRGGMKWSGKSWLTRKHSSLQIAAQVLLTWKSPMWCAMKLARGLKMVRSLPRSRHQAQLVALDRLAQFVVADLQVGPAAGAAPGPGCRRSAVAPVLQRLGRRGVVAVAVDDHGSSLGQ